MSNSIVSPCTSRFDFQNIPRFRCSHLPQLFSAVAAASPSHKAVFVINPINHPVLPSSESRAVASPSPSSNPYHRLEAASVPQPSVLTTPLFSILLPDRSCFLPVLSFVSKKGFLDIPIPTLPDFVVAFRAVLPEREEYCRSLLAPLQELRAAPHRADWAQRQNCLFFRGNPSHFALHALAFPGTERSVLVAPRHGVAEFADAQLRAAPSDRFARSLLDEKGEFAFGAMFASLLRCRFALWKWRSLWT